jgi:hypothetical protein
MVPHVYAMLREMDRFASTHSGIRRLRAIALAVMFMASACGGARPGGPTAPPGGQTQSPGGQTAGPGVGTAPPAGNAQIRLRFFPQAITDPAAGNLTAMTFLAPDGWQYQGQVQWLPEWSRTAFLQTRVSDPVSGVTVEWLPIQDFIWFPAPAGFNAPIGGNYQGKAYVPPETDPAKFVANFWMPSDLARLQGAQLVSVTQVPQIAEEFKTGFGGPANAAAYRLRYEYDSGGQRWEEDVSFALLFSGSADLTSWYVNFAYSVRAPKGQLDAAAGVVSTVVASRTTTPQWDAIYRFVQQLFTKGIQQQMADTEAFGRTLAQNRAEIQALQDQVTAERQASEDRIAELRGETLSGVQTYDDPVSGAPVQLPLGYNTYWVNQQGEYITSDQAGFDPNSLNDGFWQQLQPRP